MINLREMVYIIFPDVPPERPGSEQIPGNSKTSIFLLRGRSEAISQIDPLVQSPKSFRGAISNQFRAMPINCQKILLE